MRRKDVFDREKEWAVLSDIAGRSQPDLVFVTGRRRVGKSFLLARLAEDCGGIYYQATRRTEADQLAALGDVLGDHFDDPALTAGSSFPSWEALFAYVLRRANGNPLLLVIDEFPYLASAAPALTSIIQKLWDHEWQDSKLTLILSGSHLSIMNRLEGADQPLYGRRTAKLKFAPFTFRDVAHFVPDYDALDQLRTYAIFGHLPGNLALLDPSISIADNAANLILNPSGRLLDDAAHVLDAFLGEADIHYSIVEAIAQGHQTWSAITSRIGKASASVSRPLQWLEEMDIIARVVPMTEKNPARSKRAVYRLIDPYLSFWHRFVTKLVRAGSIGLASPDALWTSAIAPHLDDYMGPVFEHICREFVSFSDVLSFEPLRVGEWWSTASDEQVDVVATGSNGELLVGEAKWGRVTAADLQTLRRRATVIASEVGDVREVYLALFSGRGEFDQAVLDEEKRGAVAVFCGDEML